MISWLLHQKRRQQNRVNWTPLKIKNLCASKDTTLLPILTSPALCGEGDLLSVSMDFRILDFDVNGII